MVDAHALRMQVWPARSETRHEPVHGAPSAVLGAYAAIGRRVDGKHPEWAKRRGAGMGAGV